jgi:hypothetical protein
MAAGGRVAAACVLSLGPLVGCALIAGLGDYGAAPVAADATTEAVAPDVAPEARADARDAGVEAAHADAALEASPPCHDGGQLCGDACVDTLGDPLHCGGCDPCPLLPNTGAACTAGVCVLACVSGYQDCDNDIQGNRPEAGDGCECVTTKSCLGAQCCSFSGSACTLPSDCCNGQCPAFVCCDLAGSTCGSNCCSGLCDDAGALCQ